ncbi:PucR family transcriptional regulator [Streptomyces cyaneofuscatus]|uniref:Helix-turn-helix domain-containing protein n=1 Tax=Streptomyces cyaneofuscatus TaxID=66883 RepID=A0ABZ1EXB4_9ACTN|nr:helix-turn-helix domain-containing protein [Streptomyces cyaneofuscatus]WSB08786.1 helix-turn-helix domain-containing protein [Streptomyces cyaneofuscatus]WSD47680.1 helix-turn-helix domain-containing protein [Streptomyces cyaneofuscatus]
MAEPRIPEEMLGNYGQILGEVATTGRRLTRNELEMRRALGREAADAGHQLRALVTMHLAQTREAWPRAAAGNSPAVTDAVLAAVEQAVDAFAEGFERAQRLTVRREEAARREFIDDLLYGRSDLVHLAERATRFGLRLSRAHAVAVASGPEAYTETDAVPRSVEAALLARFSGRKILLTTKDGRIVCIAPGSQPDVLRYFAKQSHAATDGGQVAIGRPHKGPGGVVHSYDEALEALDLADRMGMEDPVLYASDLLVYPVLTRDRQAMADLVRSELGPLQKARGGAEPLLKTLAVYFDAGCVAAETARRLALSVRALTYRLERIHQLTGSDPADPMHRYSLQTAVIGARLLDWPAKEL